MLITLIVWIYLALLIAIFQWPDVLSMALTFLIIGTIPMVFLFLMMTRGKRLGHVRQQQRARRDADLAASVKSGVGKIDNEHTSED